MTSTLESLREHLQWAVELEHATLPPYPCALYSLCRCGHSSNKSLCDGTHREIKFREA